MGLTLIKELVKGKSWERKTRRQTEEDVRRRRRGSGCEMETNGRVHKTKSRNCHMDRCQHGTLLFISAGPRL